MIQAPYLYKTKAANALKGNWQTALLVTFFAGILTTAIDVLQSVQLPDLTAYLTGSADATEQMLAALNKVPLGTWVLLGVMALLDLLFSPMLQLGSNHYFICRMHGTEPGFAGLFSRARYWGKALWLSIIVGVKIFLWSLLLIVPGVIASVRYSMATFYLAENPEMSAWEAVEKSKEAMKNRKMSFFMLMLSFWGWMLMSMFIQMILGGMSGILSMVAGQFINLFVATYMNGSYAAFYMTVNSEPSETNGEQRED